MDNCSELNEGDMLFHQTSPIPIVRKQDSASKFRISRSTLTFSEMATEKELWSWKSEGKVNKFVPWESTIIIHTFRFY